MIHEHVHVTNDTLSLDSTLILAQTPLICQVHMIQIDVTYDTWKCSAFSGGYGIIRT